jgi:hypothetical protein
MSYPKWRHHPTLESVIVESADFEASITPDSDGWQDGRVFPTEATEDELKRGGWPKGKPRKASK